MRELSKLPPKILDWFGSDDVSGAIALTNDKLGTIGPDRSVVAKALYDMEIGLLVPSQLGDRLRHELSLPEEKIAEAVERLERMVVRPIVSDLIQTHGEDFGLPTHTGPSMENEAVSLQEKIKPLTTPEAPREKEGLLTGAAIQGIEKKSEPFFIKKDDPSSLAGNPKREGGSAFGLREVEEQHHHRVFTNTASSLSEQNKNPLIEEPGAATADEIAVAAPVSNSFAHEWEKEKSALLKDIAPIRIRTRVKEAPAIEEHPTVSKKDVPIAVETEPTHQEPNSVPMPKTEPAASAIPLEDVKEPAEEAPFRTTDIIEGAPSLENLPAPLPEAGPKMPSIIETPTASSPDIALPIPEMQEIPALPEEKTLEDLLMPETISFTETNPEVAAPIVIEGERKQEPAPNGPELPAVEKEVPEPAQQEVIRPSFKVAIKKDTVEESAAPDARPFILHEEKNEKEPGVRSFQSYEAIKPAFYKPSFSSAERQDDAVSARLEFGNEEEAAAPVMARTERTQPRVVHYSSLKTETPFGKAPGAPGAQRAEYVHPKNILNLRKDDGTADKAPGVHPENVINLKDLPQ